MELGARLAKQQPLRLVPGPNRAGAGGGGGSGAGAVAGGGGVLVEWRCFGFMELTPGAKGAWTGTLTSPARRVLARRDSARPRLGSGQSICTLQ